MPSAAAAGACRAGSWRLFDGALPLPVLERRIDAWIASERLRPRTATAAPVDAAAVKTKENTTGRHDEH